MSLLYFFIILSVLVIVHELGHFLVAKYFKIRVDEFGLGYPPRATSLFSWKGTLFTLNWLPFGGFVKIFGENPNEQGEETSANSFQSKNRGIQAAVLVAGVVGNFLFAWLLISVGFMSGLPSPMGVGLPVLDAHTVITTVLKDSPADLAGLKSGDALQKLLRDTQEADISPLPASEFIGSSPEPLTFVVTRGSETLTKVITPKDGIVAGKVGVGVALDTVGTVKLPFFKALYEGFKVTARLTYLTATALLKFIGQAITGRADLSQVTGPVGLVGMVGDVRVLGFVYLLSFTALISINLSVVNLLPIPALDGGRLLFVAIETVLRRPISPKVFNRANMIGFTLLIILMLLVTFRDIMHLI
ncbi:MAG: Zinc metalloprotease [Parcubacteria group bacterium]|nr:Zinc metalloprotease [Parcubacteria group bacterium]